MSFKGSKVLLKKGTAAAGVAIGGMRTTALNLNSETVDVTSADNSDRWRELLAEAGVQSMSISLSGVLADVGAHNGLIADKLAGTNDTYALILDEMCTFEGLFQITSFEASGEHNGEETFSITLESAGTVTHAAIT